MHLKILLFTILAVTSSVTTALERRTAINLDQSDKLTLQEEFKSNGRKAFEEWPNEEIVFNHLDFEVDDGEISSQHPYLQGAPRLKVDRLCSASNIVDNVCTIKDKTLRFSSDVFYQTNMTLIFDNTKVKCLTISYVPCSLMINMASGAGGTPNVRAGGNKPVKPSGSNTTVVSDTNTTITPAVVPVILPAVNQAANTTVVPITNPVVAPVGAKIYLELKNGSVITGKQIIITAKDSEIIIGQDSSIWASGQSVQIYGTNKAGLGASYIGQPGFCSDSIDPSTFNTYGFFDMKPNSANLTSHTLQMGSIGKANDVETAGGGRIVLISDSITFEGNGAKIQANARPYSDFEARRYDLQGGSGGYIYVSTANINKQNNLSENSTVEAMGGYGVGNATSGSGGVVILDGNFTVPADRVKVNGGVAIENQSETGCGNGAAGTVYYAQTDSLVIDNKGINSTAATAIEIPDEKQHNSFKNISEISSSLVVDGKARLLIIGERFGLTFNEIFVDDNCTVAFSEQDDPVNVRFLQNPRIGRNAVFDFSKTKRVTVYQGDVDGGDEAQTRLGIVYFKQFLAVRASNIHLTGNITIPETVDQKTRRNSTFSVTAVNIQVYENVAIQSGFLIMQANDTVEMREGSSITSIIPNSCTNVINTPDLFHCMSPNAEKADRLNYDDIVKRFAIQFPQKIALPTKKNATIDTTNVNVDNFYNQWGGISSNFSSYIIAFNAVKLQGTSIEGPRIGVCAANAIFKDSILETSAHGCPSDLGIAKGLQFAACAGSGGSNGGEGGYGGYAQNITAYQEVCKQKKSEAYQYGIDSKYEGSGGASGSPKYPLGGAGGGIIRIQILNELRMSRSQILANGGNGQKSENTTIPSVIQLLNFGSGGGAGGTISIMTRYLKGDADIQAKGGNGSLGGGGGGAGGRLAVQFLSGFSFSAQPNQSHYWRGTLSLEGGKHGRITPDFGYLQGQNGQNGVVNAGKCFGGYSGPFCQPCEAGTFKYDYSYAVCKPCENKPVNAFYSEIGSATSNCPYECSPGLDPINVNPFCKTALELQVSRLGGVTVSLSVFSGFMILVLFIWIVLIVHSQWLLRASKNFNSTVYEGVLFNTDATVDASEEIIGSRNLKMQDSDIWSHTHRMYLIGENSISFPWFIPKDFPFRALAVEHKDKLIRLIKSRQNCLSWTGLQKDSYLLSRILCPPLANLIHRCFRKRHFSLLQDEFFETFDSNFWDSRSKSKTIRLSASNQDHQLAYIDFMDYQRSKKDYIGPQLPLTLILGGSGTFNSPYYVNFEDDALAKSIVYFHQATLKTSLPLWFENLNTLLSKTSFYKFTGGVKKDLAQVIDWIEMGNKTLFNPLDTKATLYLFENSYQPVEGSSFKQRRRSFPMESDVFESFPEMFSKLVRFVKTKLTGRKSEIRLGLVFKPFNEEKRRQLHERIRRITQAQRQAEERGVGFDHGSTNLIFGSEEEDNNDEDEYSYTKVSHFKGNSKEKSKLGNIIRDGMAESTTELLSESNMESSEVYIYGTGSITSKSVKIIDKSKRAFDIGSDAVKSLELALQKPRTSCKHKMLRFRAWWYALWILFFKHHGIPPKSGTRYQYFLAYSFFLSLDTLMTLNVCFHMFQPIDNWKSIGIPYFFISPAVTVLGPIFGIIACIVASPRLLKFQASVNATAVILNYPLTLVWLIVTNDQPIYIALITLLWFNKICISYFGAKVRQHLINPGFCKNASKIEERFNTYSQVIMEHKAGVKVGMTPAERAASLVSSGPPPVGTDSDEELMNEDDTSYGIIPKERLVKNDDKSQF